MSELVDLAASWVQAVRMTTIGQWVLRGSVALAGVASVLLCWWWIPVPGSVLALALGVAVWCAAGPGSWGPFVLSLVVAFWWLGGGDAAQWWRVIPLALLLAAVHLGGAYAAAAPSWSAVTGRAGRAMAVAAALYLAACAGLSLVVVGASAVMPGLLAGGVGWVAAGVVALVAAGIAAVVAIRRRVRPATSH